VDVGGYRLQMNCQGTGQPTVVLIHGFNDYSFVWDRVQPAVARLTRVCSYDRAGQAWSDPGPRPRGLARITEELHTLLTRAGERPPFVLVGHSWGGLLPRAYLAAHPGEVAGAVFVDATSELDYMEVRDTTLRPLLAPDGVWRRLWPAPTKDTATTPPSFNHLAVARSSSSRRGSRISAISPELQPRRSSALASRVSGTSFHNRPIPVGFERWPAATQFTSRSRTW